MHVLLGNEDVKKIIADHYGLDIEQIEIDEDNLYSLEVENVLPIKKGLPTRPKQ